VGLSRFDDRLHPHQVGGGLLSTLPGCVFVDHVVARALGRWDDVTVLHHLGCAVLLLQPELPLHAHQIAFLGARRPRFPGYAPVRFQGRDLGQCVAFRTPHHLRQGSHHGKHRLGSETGVAWRPLGRLVLAAHPDGVGLAAPQINVHQRVVIVRLGARNDEDSEPDPPIGLVNPEIIEALDELKDFDGCLSFPGLYGRTIRPHYLRVSGLDETGVPFDRVFEGFDAVVVHHEIDHLDGVLFIDRIESMEDLYRIREDDDGRVVRAPVSFVI